MPDLDCPAYESVYLAIDNEITENPHLLPTLVRLAFHDCVGECCDGCLNFDDPHNAGLREAFEEIEEIYDDNNFDKVLSRSDFWQLAANVALVRGGMNKDCRVKPCPFFDLQYRYGRKDCSTSPVHDEADDAGSGLGDWKEVQRVLAGNFDLDDKEIVTLLGAHSLGGAHPKNSGFRYNWQDDFLTFDNSYYVNLINLRYKQEDAVSDTELEIEMGAEAEAADEVGVAAVGKGKKEKPVLLQFASTGKKLPNERRNPFEAPDEGLGESELLMLNVDMSLVREVQGVKNKKGDYTGELKCYSERYGKKVWIDPGVIDQVSTCEEAYTRDIVEDYAEHIEHFYDDFPAVWDKMNSHGTRGLKVPSSKDGSCGYCIPQGAYCVPGFEKSGSCCPGLKCDDYVCRPKTHREEEWYHYRN
eukprot:TRINITY_DN662_c0_g1_i1.p1 TRINITY_DN662_c0_g1~~TRINITY_DN662_c0_g1_i1.p1  ORF type:complete len:449 (-),score=67.60 TRINITY_DN662_c0_g1_i1:62-1306(-)